MVSGSKGDREYAKGWRGTGREVCRLGYGRIGCDDVGYDMSVVSDMVWRSAALVGWHGWSVEVDMRLALGTDVPYTYR